MWGRQPLVPTMINNNQYSDQQLRARYKKTVGSILRMNQGEFNEGVQVGSHRSSSGVWGKGINEGNKWDGEDEGQHKRKA